MGHAAGSSGEPMRSSSPSKPTETVFMSRSRYRGACTAVSKKVVIALNILKGTGKATDKWRDMGAAEVLDDILGRNEPPPARVGYEKPYPFAISKADYRKAVAAQEKREAEARRGVP